MGKERSRSNIRLWEGAQGSIFCVHSLLIQTSTIYTTPMFLSPFIEIRARNKEEEKGEFNQIRHLHVCTSLRQTRLRRSTRRAERGI